MNCHESTYDGFSSTAPRYKTCARPASDIPVRQLRRAYRDNSSSSASRSRDSEGDEAPNFDWLGYLGCVCGLLYYIFSKTLLYDYSRR